MDLSSPSNPDAATGLRPSRRKSGRVTKQPEVLSPSTDAGAKRKHAEASGKVVNGMSGSESEPDEGDGEPDEEELRERKRKNRKIQSTKPQQKRATAKRIDGVLPVRPAASRPKKAKRAAPIAIAGAQEVGGLYAELFGQNTPLDQVAAQWNTRFDAHQSLAVAEIVNFVLRSAGCEEEVSEYDIEDPDEAPNKLTEIQTIFQKQIQVDYPIISKSKGSANFKRTLTGFFEILIDTLAATGKLYSEPILMDNIQVWVGTMSSASNRPFRHTASIAALAIIDGLCTACKALSESKAKWQRQAEGEKNKSRVNKGRVDDLKQKEGQEDEKLAIVDNLVQEWVDTVFVHRYRDVDPHVRLDCIMHLSQWIATYPDKFFDGQYLRYLCWLLFDPSAPTRHEVVKQLHRLYKDSSKTVGLQNLTERFKDRMLEIATRDADPGVRASMVEMLNTLREVGLLEPNDIDAIGQLIFDTEPRVRKAVVPFFVANVQDSFGDKLDQLGGEEALAEGLPGAEVEEFESIRLEWLKFKALAELLESFDPMEISSLMEAPVGGGNEILIAQGVDSRFSLAAHSLFPGLKELSLWQYLAGYLLFDGSSADAGSDLEAQMRNATRLSEKEEAILLDLLNIAVKLSVTEVVQEGKAEKTKRSKKDLEAQQEKQEEAAQTLSIIIPRLLNKFGALPAAASAVLRIQRTLNLDVFQQLRQDSTTFSELLDNVLKQFASHPSTDVISEASNALLHARSFESLGEITDEHLKTLWETTCRDLVKHCRGEDLGSRGSIDKPMLDAINGTVLRIMYLSRVSDCTSALETPVVYTSRNNARRKQSSTPPVVPLELLFEMVTRGHLGGPSVEEDVVLVEDELVTNILSSLLHYFQWHTLKLREASTSPGREDLETLQASSLSLTTAITALINNRPASTPDKVRNHAASTLLDLHVVFTIETTSENAPPSLASALRILSTPLSKDQQTSLLSVFSTSERDYARKASKKLEGPTEDEDPEDLSDDESEAGSTIAADNAGDTSESQVVRTRREQKHRDALIAEHSLCQLAAKFVLAIISGVVDADVPEGQVGAVRRRICRNKGRLGANFNQVLSALEEPKKIKLERARAAKAAKAKLGQTRKPAPGTGLPSKAGKVAKSKEVIDDEDEEEEGQDDARMADGVDDEDVLRKRGLVVDEEVARRDVEGDVDRSPDESVVGD